MEISNLENELVTAHGYKIVKRIGSGSYSVVYLCELSTPRILLAQPHFLACKVVDAADVKAEFVNKFFPRELDIISTLKHPNIIQTFGVYSRDSKYFIFMRFAESGDLLEYILENGKLNEKRARFWTSQIASGLNYMHSKNIVHRDLKCENILITSNKNIKICDFGFGKQLSTDDSLSSTWCGSLAYASPEILEMRSYNAKKVDSWALGVVLYISLTKTMPFNEKSPRAMLTKQKSKLDFIGKQWHNVSSSAKTCIMKLLEIEPKNRWLPSNVLKCTWISGDPGIKSMLRYLSVKESSRSKLPKIINFDRRRLSSQLGGENSKRFSLKSSHQQIENVVSIKLDNSSIFLIDGSSSTLSLTTNSMENSSRKKNLT